MSGKSIYDFKVKTIEGRIISLEDFRGKVLLIVNTASKCGFTPQYEELESIYKKYNAMGFEILGFPCNQFASQEQGTEEEILQFCQLNYSVTFPMFSKIEVNGNNSHPLYQFLKSEARGFLGTKEIKWNFTKFLVNRNGKVVARYAPAKKPTELESKILRLLKLESN
jgi:glutathione peroxidase